MRTRRVRAAPTSARVHHGLAALMVIGGLGGCAQVLGLETWKPQTCESSGDVDPSLCETPMSCSECLFSTQTTCGTERQACVADTMTCEPIDACSQACDDEPDPLTCIKSCCDTTKGNALFDMYLTCLCGECEEACGVLSLDCPMYCDSQAAP